MLSKSVSLEQLRQAVAIKEQIASLEAQLAALIGGAIQTAASPAAAKTRTSRNGKAPVPAGPAPAQKRRGGARDMSPEAKARIAAAQKQRWAKFRAAKAGGKPPKTQSTAPAAKKKRVISPEGKARIIAATKARWEKFRAQKGK